MVCRDALRPCDAQALDPDPRCLESKGNPGPSSFGGCQATLQGSHASTGERGGSKRSVMAHEVKTAWKEVLIGYMKG